MSQLSISFDYDLVPINYQWSKYSEDSDEFKGFNFLLVEHSGVKHYVCSEENGVALGDYLANYIFCERCIRDLESLYSPGMDYWFYKAWEQAEPYYEELPVWVHRLVELLITAGYISRITYNDAVYFVFSDLVKFEQQSLPDNLLNEVAKICRLSLVEFCEQFLADYGSTDELTEFDISDWAERIINEFVIAHSEGSDE